jgi:hypothetical protein
MSGRMPLTPAVTSIMPGASRRSARLRAGWGYVERRGARALRALAFAFGRLNRSRKVAFALKVAERLDVDSVLLIGVSGASNAVNNQIERALVRSLPYVVASGLSAKVTGWEPFVVADGRRLPFADSAFDLVYANAVIEHVGGLPEQAEFAEELARVGRAWIITTPNRWFPVEAHYHTLLTHWRTSWGPRGTVTRLLGIRDLRMLTPRGVVRGVPVLSPTLTAVGRGKVGES